MACWRTGLIDFAFHSTRLSVRPIEPDIDLDAVAGIIAPAVTQHLPPELQTTPDADPAKWLKRLTEGGDVCTVHAGGELIGFLTLHRRSQGEIMIGYLFGQAHWGKGYASEMLAGFVDYLKRSGWHGEVHGGVDAANPASARVLEKVGFVRSGVLPDGGSFFTLVI